MAVSFDIQRIFTSTTLATAVSSANTVLALVNPNNVIDIKLGVADTGAATTYMITVLYKTIGGSSGITKVVVAADENANANNLQTTMNARLAPVMPSNVKTSQVVVYYKGVGTAITYVGLTAITQAV